MIDVMINIDCRDGMKSIPDKSIDMVCTDLPYGITRNKWDTPILCIHGEKDFRILANQAMAAFDAAVMRGVPAELLIYPDENHWVLKPQNGVLWQRTFFEWLDKWLK